MIKNKKAWLRIVESVFAILIIFGAVLFIVSKQNYRQDPSDIVYEKQTKIFDIISKNETLRQLVIDEKKDEIEAEISKFMPASWSFGTCITTITQICSPAIPKDKNVYVKETIIFSTLKDYKPKKLRLFIWMK